MSDFGLLHLKDSARLRYTVRAYRQSPTLCAEHLVAFARPLLGVIVTGLDASDLFRALDAVNTWRSIARRPRPPDPHRRAPRRGQRIAQTIADAFVAAETAGEGEGFEVYADREGPLAVDRRERSEENGGRPVLVAALPEHGVAVSLALTRTAIARPGYDCIAKPCGKNGCVEGHQQHGRHCIDWLYAVYSRRACLSLSPSQGITRRPRSRRS